MDRNPQKNNYATMLNLKKKYCTELMYVEYNTIYFAFTTSLIEEL